MNTTNTLNQNFIYGLSLAALLSTGCFLKMDGSASNDMSAEEWRYASPAHTQLTPFEDMVQDLSLEEIEAVFQRGLRTSAKANAKALAAHLYKEANRFGLSPSMILAVIQAESSFRVGVESHMGAMGLMQVKPSTAHYIDRKYKLGVYKKASDLNNPKINITLGVAYLSYLRMRFQNSLHYITAYNKGPTAVSVMLKQNTFEYGKLEKYVKEIHNGARNFRKEGGSSKVQIATL